MMKKPKIRFNGFNDDWEQRKLGEVCEAFEYGLNVAAKEYDGENKYIRITDIDDNSREFLQKSITSPDVDLSDSENYKLKYGDILFARTGSSVGKTYIYKESDGLVYYAGFLIRGRVKDDYAPEFVFQNTLTDDYDKFIRITSQRSGQPGVNAQEYEEYSMLVPNIDEQTKIGEVFRNLDNLITLHQRKCEATKKLKKYMLQNMFPQDREKTPKIRFDGFTDDWEQRKLGEVVDFYNGDRSSRYPNDSDMVQEGIPFINAGDLVSGQVKLDTANKITEEKYNELSGAKIQRGDIIYCLRGTLGKNAFVDNFDVGTVASSLVDIRPKKIVGKYLFQVLNSDIEYRQRTVNDEGAAQPNLSAKNLSLFDIPMPTEDEQEKIASYFDSLDNLITLHQRKINELQTLKKYMLQNMFV